MKRLTTMAALAAVGITITACGGSSSSGDKPSSMGGSSSDFNMKTMGAQIQKQAQQQLDSSNTGPGKDFVFGADCMEQQDGKGAKCSLSVDSTDGYGKVHNQTMMVDVTYGKDGQFSWVPAN